MVQQQQEEELGIPTSSPTTTTTTTTTTIVSDTSLEPPTAMFSDDIDNDSTCSTPYVSAPSSPGRGTPISGFYYSAPASPMHFILSNAAAMNMNSSSIPTHAEVSPASSTCSFEFDFSARLTTTNGTASTGSMSSADELFLNGQIRPMKLSTHLQRPQMLAPLLDLEDPDDAFGDEVSVISERGRDSKLRDRSLRRRTRSMSPLRSMSFEWDGDFDVKSTSKNEEKKKHVAKDKQLCDDDNDDNNNSNEEEEVVSSETTTPCESGASSRSSSVGRSSRRWVFLKEFLYRSKSEGRNNGHKFWGSLSFSPVKDKIKMEKFTNPKISSNTSNLSSKEKTTTTATPETLTSECTSSSVSDGKKPKQSGNGVGVGAKDVKKKTANSSGKAVNGVGKRRVPPSPHELHYTANRAQSEEMRKKTFLPYKQGLLGCLGFSSKSYGAMNGFARALNPVSSR